MTEHRNDRLSDLSSDLENQVSEQSNPASEQLDGMTPLEIAVLMNQQDKLVVSAVEKNTTAIAEAIECAVRSLREGGRLIYVGAGSSGRLGVLDAAEIPPTFSMPPDRVMAIIAGGEAAMFVAQEGAEDDAEQGAADIAAKDVGPQDTVVGLASSGRTPYVLGALAEARKRAAVCVGISCNPSSALALQSDIAITPVVGPEVLAGSTRLKSGTAQKMVLNMISTGAMVQIGKCFGNRMVDMRASNQKLKARAINLVQDIGKVDKEKAFDALVASGWNTKASVLIAACKLDLKTALHILEQCDGQLRRALAMALDR